MQVYVSNQEIAITTCSLEQMGHNSITEGGLQARCVHRFKIITPLSATKRSEDGKHMQTLETISVDERTNWGNPELADLNGNEVAIECIVPLYRGCFHSL